MHQAHKILRTLNGHFGSRFQASNVPYHNALALLACRLVALVLLGAYNKVYFGYQLALGIG